MDKTKGSIRLKVKFFRQGASGSEPVREWLRSLPEIDKKAIGRDIKAVQYGWPLGLPLVDHLGHGIWEVRTQLKNKIVRVFFAVEGACMILLHGFVKKSQKTPQQDLELAQARLKQLRGET